MCDLSLFSQFTQICTLFLCSTDFLGVVMRAREELYQLILSCVQKSVLNVLVFYFAEAVLGLFYVKE